MALHTREVAGSKPAAPILHEPRSGAVSLFSGRFESSSLPGSCPLRATASACLTPSLGLGADDGIELVATRVVEAPGVTHIRYTVAGRSKLVLDDRGASGDLVGPA
jgi:hypothetical protein